MNSNAISIDERRERVLPILALTVTVTWLGDFLFWNHAAGLSVAIYAAVLTIALLALPDEERPRRVAWIAAGLALLSSFATVVEISFSNSVVIIALLAVIMAERHFRELPSGWARWSESLVACVQSPGRWRWLARACAESELARVGFDSQSTDRAARSLQIVAPAACLAIVFGIILSSGNAVFGELLSRSACHLMSWVFSFDFSIARCFLWIALANLALVLIHPSAPSNAPRFWTRPPGVWARQDLTVAIWQSAAVLITLNALFFVVNTIDAVYLWNHGALPVGVTFSQFVHRGVYSLILAVLFSAVIIAAIFQQEAPIARRSFVKMLAWAWIAQNVVLIAGVFLRLKLYVEAYQLSELRVYVGCFLALVTIGFALLAWHIAKGEKLETLLWRNLLATFALFFVIQFPDVAGWVANFNVARWQRQPTRALDLGYLKGLGSSAWPALTTVATSRDRFDLTSVKAREIVSSLAAEETENRMSRDWRSYQARRDSHGRELISAAERLQIP